MPRWKAHARTLAVEARLAGADVADLALRGADIRIDGRGVAEELALGRVRVAWRRAGIRPIDQSPEHLRASQSFEVLAGTSGCRRRRGFRSPTKSRVWSLPAK